MWCFGTVRDVKPITDYLSVLSKILNKVTQKMQERKNQKMGVVGYFEFKGVKYGIGTIVRVPRYDDLRWFSKEELLTEAIFVGGGYFNFTQIKGSVFLAGDKLKGKYEEYIEIVKPVYYQEPEPPKPTNIFFRTGSGSWEAHNDVVYGFIIYMVVMIIATLFKARVGLWILATIVYFGWKSKK